MKKFCLGVRKPSRTEYKSRKIMNSCKKMVKYVINMDLENGMVILITWKKKLIIKSSWN